MVQIAMSSTGFQLAELFEPGECDKARLAAQAGATHAIVRLAPTLARVARSEYLSVLRAVQAEIRAAGLEMAGVESHPVPAERIKLGLAGRDEEIENYVAVIRDLATIGVRLLCYNWMAGLGWCRTRFDVSERHGALVTEFDAQEAEKQGFTEWGPVAEQSLWENIEYFLEAVLPVAEREGVRMALHPDDPPVSPLRGIGRIFTSGGAFRRILAAFPSPVNGIAFCQATFGLMGEDVETLAREWCGQGKIFFIHFRDVAGTRERFRETFHDNGPTDMARMLRVYHEAGFSGPIRPDHAPTLNCESNDRPGYAMGGKLIALGYMKGILDALGIPYCRS